MDFLQKLELQMRAKDIRNLKELSSKSDVPYTTLRGFYDKGTENIKLSTLNKLKEFFDCTLDYLVDDSITDPNFGRDIISDKTQENEPPILTYYNKLNSDGQKHATEYVENLTFISKYQKQEFAEELFPNDTLHLTQEDEKELEMIKQEMLAEKKGRTSSASTSAKDA